MQNNKVEVSIHCLAYNHAKYIRKTFDGFLNQKTKFAFEVLVHDDASTDGTTEIIQEYANKYPDIFKPLYQEENQYSKGIQVAYTYNFPRASGKYIAYCEGDDYWCDELKLQKQYDIMQTNPECSMCVHVAQVISEDGGEVIGTIPQEPVKTGVILPEQYLRKELIEGWAAQTSSFFVRRDYLFEYIKAPLEYRRFMMMGDFPTVLYMLTKGNIYFINETMSCYRFGGSGSFRHSRKQNPYLQLRHLFSIVYGLEEYNKYTDYKYEQLIKTSLSMKLEQLEIMTRSLKEECETYYLKELYDNRTKSVRTRLSYTLRRYCPSLYFALVRIYTSWKMRK